MPELTCFRLLDTESPAGPLAEAVRQVNEGQGGAAVFALDPISFEQVPNAPFAYWVEEKVRKLFKELPLFESQDRTARQGLATADDFRFVRCWWECGHDSSTKPFAKGGGVSPFYADIFMRVNWRHDGAELNASDSARVQNTVFYFKPGCFQTLRSLRLAPHLTPRGCVFSHNGFQYFANESDLLWLLGLTNSNFFESLYRLNVGKDEMPLFIAGVMQLVPVPVATSELKAEMELITLQSWNNRRQLSVRSERSPWFRQPFGLVGAIAETASHEQKIINQLDSDFLSLSQKIDALALKAYGNVKAISVGHSSRTRPIDAQGDEEESDESDSSIGPAIFSYLFGLAFGRWSLTQLKQSPDAGLPSDSLTELPDVPPGSIGANPRLYAVSSDISDDEIISLIRLQLSKVFKGDSEAELCDLLKANTLLEYLGKPSAFFAYHLKVYSKSRRKAPIYWPLSTKSGNFTIWVYYPKLDNQSLPKLIADVLSPKIRTLTQEIENRRAAPGGKIAELESLRQELEEMRTDFTDLINRGYVPNQNDGVLITACPLAKYFRHAGFRKELEGCWKKLSQGDYDWAHLAMSMWPNRVLEVCKKDRSIAIAHGKEELCSPEPAKAKRASKKPKSDE